MSEFLCLPAFVHSPPVRKKGGGSASVLAQVTSGTLMSGFLKSSAIQWKEVKGHMQFQIILFSMIVCEGVDVGAAVMCVEARGQLSGVDSFLLGVQELSL